MRRVRVGIIGLGSQGKLYAECLDRGMVSNMELIAVFNRSDEGLRWAEENLQPAVKKYSDIDEMLNCDGLEAVIVCVAHFQHPEFAILAFQHGLHVLSEKPAGVYTNAVKKMNLAAEKSGKKYAIMWNLRVEPTFSKLKQLIDNHVLGEIRRVTWITTNWYRTQAYYDSSAWRATWAGEGGGILMNQCAHNLDMLQWLFGMPTQVRAFCRYGVRRDIEVENDVTAYMEYPNGAIGLFVASTYEFPGTNRLEISGDYGKIVVEAGKITLCKSAVNESEFNRVNTSLFDLPELSVSEIGTEPRKEEEYLVLMRNFADAILYDAELISPGEEGLREIALCNALQLSDWTGAGVDPGNLDDDLFESLLKARIEGPRT